ncbi:MAG: arsenate reductase family protein, partial [Chryseobacterium sp.]|nr:arsenate reductase family protein [Chryseobacterium sp.]
MSQFDLSDWELRELKSENISAEELDNLYKHTNSYETLFSKKSTQ